MTARSRYTLVARVGSASEPGREPWDVKTDGQVLTCACPRWRFRQELDAAGERTCRHVRHVEGQLRDLDLGVLSGAPELRAVAGRLRARPQPALGAASLVAARRSAQAFQPAVAAQPEPCDLECGNRFFTGQLTCRHGRNIGAAVATLTPRQAAAVANAAPAETTPDWLGGGRAILLRE